jgi:hypothetical protein
MLNGKMVHQWEQMQQMQPVGLQTQQMQPAWEMKLEISLVLAQLRLKKC